MSLFVDSLNIFKCFAILLFFVIIFFLSLHILFYLLFHIFFEGTVLHQIFF